MNKFIPAQMGTKMVTKKLADISAYSNSKPEFLNNT